MQVVYVKNFQTPRIGYDDKGILTWEKRQEMIGETKEYRYLRCLNQLCKS